MAKLLLVIFQDGLSLRPKVDYRSMSVADDHFTKTPFKFPFYKVTLPGKDWPVHVKLYFKTWRIFEMEKIYWSIFSLNKENIISISYGKNMYSTP